MRKLPLLLLLAAAASARADTLADVKRTLAALRGTSAVNALFEARHTNKASGRFFTQNLNVHSMAEVHGGEEGMRVTLSRATLERLRAQRAAPRHDDADGSEQAGDVAPAQVAELLDYAPSLQATLARAVLVGEREAALGSVPARLLAFKVPPERSRAKEVKVESNGDDLSLWVGRDGVPLAAERKGEFSAGFLFLKVSGRATDKWTFARHDDRLVVTHHEHTGSGGGMGQMSVGTEVQTIALR
jgi:uncharacterized small protein (DUF1192 family)